MADRKLDNWLDAFLEWTLPRSEAKEHLIRWSGLFALSSAVRRHVYFPESMMGSYSIYPNLYILFVGPAGAVRKSTTTGYAEHLLTGLSHTIADTAYVKIASTAMSDSKLVQTLSESPDGSLCIISSEFSSFVNVSQESMYDLLTDLYDGKLKYEYATRMHGIEIVDDPCVNMIGATTPKWIATAPEHMTGGGFASRVIFIFENEVRRRKLYYDHLKWDHFKKLRSDLRHDLKHIARLKGEFRHDSQETKERVEDWYKKFAASIQEKGEARVEGYFQRKHVHAHKLAMLLSVAESDEPVATFRHFEQAIEMLEEVEEKMPRALATAGRNPYSAEIDQVEDFIRYQDGPVPKGRILAKFYHDIPTDKTEQILSALVAMDRLELHKEKGGRTTKYFYSSKR